jgi:hypothetical protein
MDVKTYAWYVKTYCKTLGAELTDEQEGEDGYWENFKSPNEMILKVKETVNRNRKLY